MTQSPCASVFDPVPLLSLELNIPTGSVQAVLSLAAEGATVPFIARYRKEATGSLDEVQIRSLLERHAYLVELEERRAAILGALEEGGQLTDSLRSLILGCATKAALEDLYLPYRPKRRTRASIARERGLLPLAERIAAQPATGDPLAEAAAFVAPEKDVADATTALAGARDILAERSAEDRAVRALVRERIWKEGRVRATVLPAKALARTKFETYYDYAEPAAAIPSHRFLAILRGEREEVLRVGIELDLEALLPQLLTHAGYRPESPFAAQLVCAVQDGAARLLLPSLETEALGQLKERSDRAAVEVFADNLKNLLLSAPLGTKPVIGVDPGLRSGCKCAAVDTTGKLLEHLTIFPSQGEAAREKARAEFTAFAARLRPFAVAIGNGTAARETEAFVREALGAESPIVVAMVSEAGASVYSASDLAREEFPDLDLTIRGAVSIARRLQDPLAELVKIEPKSIGVGQYQHDVQQALLSRKLDAVVESCVNAVGVELNTASAALLSYVSGIGPSLAKKIVWHRDAQGAFSSRAGLLEVGGFGPKTFEQAAGFLRVRGGEHPLDASAVHPERYALVERMAEDLAVALSDLVGNEARAAAIPIQRYLGHGVGEPTLQDIITELKKPGRDPRREFEAMHFSADVRELGDLETDMELEGVVTNVTAFGAFVDVGVHRDGLVHVSQLADRFVRDPKEVVKVGDRLRVRVLEVDLVRQRLSLTARREGPRPPATPDEGTRPAATKPDRRPPAPRGKKRPTPDQDDRALSHNPFAKLLKR